MPKYEYHRESAMPGKGPGVMCEGLSEACLLEMRAFVTNNWTDSEAYRLKDGVMPFVQGEDLRSGWLFIEFWGQDVAKRNRYAEALHEIFNKHYGALSRPKRYTVEMFSEENLDKYFGGRILTLAEAAQQQRGLASRSEVMPPKGAPGAIIYVSNHSYAHGVLPDTFVSTTVYFPRRIKPRPAFPDGVLETAADELRFDRHCNPRTVVIESVEQLVEYLNTHYT